MRELGKYEIIEEIGRGGFAVVYRARDTELDRLVALKVLHPYWSEDQGFVARFRQEARTAARLRHPNVVTVYDAGEVEGQLYIAMEHLPGRTLRELLEVEGALGLEQALPILEQLARALDYAHGQGVVHRDVKPNNVMVEEAADGIHATLMDFGLVKAMSGSTALTSQGTLLGSPEYMAPEQADLDRRSEIGPATDRYALGVVAYQVLTGQVPFPGNTPSTLVAHMQKAPPDPRGACASLSAGVCQVLLKALSKSPRGRYPTAMAMVDALRRTDEKTSRSQAAAGLGHLWSSAWKWVLVGALVIALLSGGVWFGSRISPRSTPTAIAQRATATSVPTLDLAAATTETWTPKPTATPTEATATFTPRPTSTPTPKPTATSTLEPTETPTSAPSPTPTLGPGSTRVREKGGAVMVYVPAGEFRMGSTDEDIDAVMMECSSCERESFTNEQPRRKVYVDAFWIDQTEVTNAQYKKCVDAGACSPSANSGSITRRTYYGNPEFDGYPVIVVNWHQAHEYAKWVGGRLPTEAEWEYAARGPNGDIHPWGNDPPNNSLLNYNSSVGDTTAVGSYPDGASWCGALDMAGNVSEWTSSLYKEYPYDPTDGREDMDAKGDRVLRGGAFNNASRDVRCAVRYRNPPDHRFWIVGFRVVVSPG